MDAFGAREFSKYRLELQTKITAQMAAGITVQVISIHVIVFVAAGCKFPGRRRYLIAKYKIVEKIITVKIKVMPVRKKCSLSTPSAIVELGSGRSGIPGQSRIARIGDKRVFSTFPFKS